MAIAAAAGLVMPRYYHRNTRATAKKRKQDKYQDTLRQIGAEVDQNTDLIPVVSFLVAQYASARPDRSLYRMLYLSTDNIHMKFGRYLRDGQLDGAKRVMSDDHGLEIDILEYEMLLCGLWVQSKWWSCRGGSWDKGVFHGIFDLIRARYATRSIHFKVLPIPLPPFFVLVPDEISTLFEPLPQGVALMGACPEYISLTEAGHIRFS